MRSNPPLRTDKMASLVADRLRQLRVDARWQDDFVIVEASVGPYSGSMHVALEPARGGVGLDVGGPFGEWPPEVDDAVCAALNGRTFPGRGRETAKAIADEIARVLLDAVAFAEEEGLEPAWARGPVAKLFREEREERPVALPPSGRPPTVPAALASVAALDVIARAEAEARETLPARRIVETRASPDVRDRVITKMHPTVFRVSPKFQAVLAYFLGDVWTDPCILSMSMTSDGFVTAFRSDGSSDFVGAAEDLRDNIIGAGRTAGLDREEAAYLLAQVLGRVEKSYPGPMSRPLYPPRRR